MKHRDVDQLKLDYSDPAWRRKFVEFCDLIEILGDCTIADSYAISDALNASIRLSESGNQMLDRLTRKEKVNAKDARLICALAIGHVDLFVDIDAMDLEKFAAAIHAELNEHSIRFPFIYGRQLYDAYADLFEDEKDLLTNEETIRLLERIPDGVFQYGSYTVGPFGLQKSLNLRNMSASRRIPAYHCARATCHDVHPVVLQTGHNASIIRERDKLENILQSSKDEASEWWAFAAEVGGSSDAYYKDQRAGVLLPLIGDTLSDIELQLLVEDLLDTTQGELRTAVGKFVTVHRAKETAETLNRAQLLQVVLTAREEAISVSLDRLVRSEQIVIPMGDVRRPVINNHVRSGAFRLRAELGHHGVRFISDDPGLALLRERRLLNKLYLREQGADVQELEWQLRGIDVEDLDERLEHFFHTKSPREALERLVLARKTNMVAACHEAGIENGDGLSDEELIEALLWKLGFQVTTGEDPHADFWKRHERLWALTQSSSIGASERFLEAAGPYFSRLEGVLLDALAFTSWALMVDHTGEDIPFSYDDHDDREKGLELLESAASQAVTDEKDAVRFTSQRIELYNLIHGFRILAAHLEQCRTTPELYARPKSELPEFDGKTDLKVFLLRSTIPFMDLSRPSQDRIISGLRDITSAMDGAEVSQVRNDYAHYRRTAPDIARVETALEATRQAMTKLENLGFGRLLFTPSTVTTDAWGQRSHEFVGPRSYEHAFTRPTPYDWMGLPPLTEPQHLLQAASFGDPNEVLRFTRRYQSEFSTMWSNYPKRRRRGPGSLSTDEVPTSQDEVEVSRS